MKRTMGNPELTHTINQKNIEAVRKGIIQKKNYNCPYYPSIDDVTAVVTDQDTFPYPRYFRGEWKSSEPIVFEREAGFRTQEDNCYRMNCYGTSPKKPRYCWTIPGSTVLPCHPDDQFECIDKAECDLLMRKNCIPVYR